MVRIDTDWVLQHRASTFTAGHILGSMEIRKFFFDYVNDPHWNTYHRTIIFQRKHKIEFGLCALAGTRESSAGT